MNFSFLPDQGNFLAAMKIEGDLPMGDWTTDFNKICSLVQFDCS